MSMTRKHYEAIAANIKHALGQTTRTEAYVIGRLAETLSFTFSDFNGAFDRKRFMTACGVNIETLEKIKKY